MGSSGSKPRKPDHSQHLPKVGTATENERLLHEEREAVFGSDGRAQCPRSAQGRAQRAAESPGGRHNRRIGLLVVFH